MTPSRKREAAKSRVKLCLLKAVKTFFQKYLLLLRAETSKFAFAFAFPLGAVPLVFTEIDGTLKKTPKSALLHKLEAYIPPVEDVHLKVH